ncbi:MAG: copper resistance D family protein, partial [Steroidobacteraceae bacterium]
TTASLRILGMAVVAAYGFRVTSPTAVGRTIGAIVAVLSLLLAGHTSTHAERWMLAPLLVFHLLVAAWWFGSLIPLAMAVHSESPAYARDLVDRFSATAGWLVPGLALAGLLMAVVITKGHYSVGDSYDLALTGKAVGFALLMGLAALNRWRLAPSLSSGRQLAVRAFTVSLTIEYLLISGVVVLTAAMTSLFSPEQM